MDRFAPNCPSEMIRPSGESQLGQLTVELREDGDVASGVTVPSALTTTGTLFSATVAAPTD